MIITAKEWLNLSQSQRYYLLAGASFVQGRKRKNTQEL